MRADCRFVRVGCRFSDGVCVCVCVVDAVFQEGQRAFYQFSLADGLSGGDKANHIKSFLESKERHTDTFAENGEFLPLGVWQVRGFDTALIQAKSLPQDRQVHPILGDTYRLRLVSTQKTFQREQVRGRKYARGGVLPEVVDAPPPARVPSPLAIADGQPDKSEKSEEEARSTSSDSTSSSSSSGDKKKKQKKSKKAAKKAKKSKKDKKDKKDNKDDKDKGAKKRQHADFDEASYP